MPPTLTYKLKKARGTSPVARIPDIIRAGAIVIQDGKAIAMEVIPKGTFLGYVFPHSILRKKIGYCLDNDKEDSIILKQRDTGEVIICKKDKETHFSAYMLFFNSEMLANIMLMPDSRMKAIRNIDLGDEITCFLGRFDKCFVDEAQNISSNVDSAWFKSYETDPWEELIDAIEISYE